jgi:hypothetical protein
MEHDLRSFRWRGHATRVDARTVGLATGGTRQVTAFTNEFWTSRQRAAHSLHEISYRACFKPQLPRFFLERLSTPGDRVYDPFMGRGTTLLEAALLGRISVGCDVSPLARVLVGPRMKPPTLSEVGATLEGIDFRDHDEYPDELLVFFHPDTLREICALKKYLSRRVVEHRATPVDAWIRMVGVNRLTGHSPGFFSVYTLPPNQAVSLRSQARINERRNQEPPRRDVPGLIFTKSRNLLRDCDQATARTLKRTHRETQLLTGNAAATPEIASGSVRLIVTSPPFLDVVDYATDNWLRCWFCGIDPAGVRAFVLRRLEDWKQFISSVFVELRRVLVPGGHLAFEVGEVRGGTVRLEETVVECGLEAGLEPLLILVNAQRFTKTANCWGVRNNQQGTNTNRVVLLRKA